MIRNGVETLYHPCCTARMAPLEDGGVVDTALRVYGIANLRIVDASVFPNITSGHTVSVLMPLVRYLIFIGSNLHSDCTGVRCSRKSRRSYQSRCDLSLKYGQAKGSMRCRSLPEDPVQISLLAWSLRALQLITCVDVFHFFCLLFWSTVTVSVLLTLRSLIH